MQQDWNKLMSKPLRMLTAVAVLAATQSYAQDTKQMTRLEKKQTILSNVVSDRQRDFALHVPSKRALGRCWPADDCSMPDKPCYLELPQDDFSKVLIGGDEKAPLIASAAFRVRLCTSNADSLDNALCEDFSTDQKLDYTFFNLKEDAMDDQIVVWGVLDSTTDAIDTGPYTEVGTHNFFGVTCQYGDDPCRIVWQYCELLPPDPTETM